MTGWLLDTNVVAAITGPHPEPRVSQWLGGQPEYSLFISILTLAEYRKGIAHLPPGSKLRPRIQLAVAALESRFYGRILSVSDSIALRWGTISGEVKRQSGLPHGDRHFTGRDSPRTRPLLSHQKRRPRRLERRGRLQPLARRPRKFPDPMSALGILRFHFPRIEAPIGAPR